MNTNTQRWMVRGPINGKPMGQNVRLPLGTIYIGRETREYGRELWMYFDGERPPEPIAPFELVAPPGVAFSEFG
jgi:hypothetical protein